MESFASPTLTVDSAHNDIPINLVRSVRCSGCRLYLGLILLPVLRLNAGDLQLTPSIKQINAFCSAAQVNLCGRQRQHNVCFCQPHKLSCCLPHIAKRLVTVHIHAEPAATRCVHPLLQFERIRDPCPISLSQSHLSLQPCRNCMPRLNTLPIICGIKLWWWVGKCTRTESSPSPPPMSNIAQQNGGLGFSSGFSVSQLRLVSRNGCLTLMDPRS